MLLHTIFINLANPSYIFLTFSPHFMHRDKQIMYIPVERQCSIRGSSNMVLKKRRHKYIFELLITLESSSQDDQISLQWGFVFPINRNPLLAKAKLSITFFQNDASFFNSVIEFLRHCWDQTRAYFLKEAVHWYHSILCQPELILYMAFNKLWKCPSLWSYIN